MNHYWRNQAQETLVISNGATGRNKGNIAQRCTKPPKPRKPQQDERGHEAKKLFDSLLGQQYSLASVNSYYTQDYLAALTEAGVGMLGLAEGPRGKNQYQISHARRRVIRPQEENIPLVGRRD